MSDPLREFLTNVGSRLGFDVREEVEASQSAWVDLVWFDKKLPIPDKADKKRRLHMRTAPVLPVVGFEIELKTASNPKHVKGSVSNLSTLNAQLGVIVVGNGNIDDLLKKPQNQKKTREQVEKELRERVYRWVFSEAQSKGRIIVMFENEVKAWWADKVSAIESSTASKTMLLTAAAQAPQ